MKRLDLKAQIVRNNIDISGTFMGNLPTAPYDMWAHLLDNVLGHILASKYVGHKITPSINQDIQATVDTYGPLIFLLASLGLKLKVK